MRWWIKVQAQRLLSRAPGGEALYYELQKRFGGYSRFRVGNKISQGVALLAALHAAGYAVENKATLEIGVGWVPLVPMLFFLFGQRECIGLDVRALLKADLALLAAGQMRSHEKYLAEKVPWAWSGYASARLARIEEVHDLAELLDVIRLGYLAPADARNTHLLSESVDIVFSNTTLEHIPTDQLTELFTEARRILSPSGVMVHLIDCSDHFSHDDPKLSRIGFLRYSDQEWRKYNTKFTYQNRLRASQYRRMIGAAGFEILFWESSVSPRLQANPPDFALDPQFRAMNFDDVCTTLITVVARPQRGRAN